MSCNNPLDPDYRRYVIGAVNCAAGFMEAFINEVFQDAHDKSPNRIAALTPEAHAAMLAVWAVTEARGKHIKVLDKYEMALRFAKQATFATGAEPYQSAALLIQLRNFFTHYKPKSLGTGENGTQEMYGLESELTGRFSPNPHMVSLGNTWFPDKAVGVGMAEWAVAAARALVYEFMHRTGMEYPE